MTCLHFHKGALACKLNSLPCTKILWKGNPCSSFEPSTKKKKADSKRKKVLVNKESKIKKDKDIKKKNLKLFYSLEEINLNKIKSQFLSTINNHTLGKISNQQLFSKLQLSLTHLHPLCLPK